MHVAAQMAPAVDQPIWLYILAALLAGGLIDLGWRIWQRARGGRAQDAMEIAEAAQDSARSSHELFTRYKVELEDAKQQLNQYLEQLVSVNRDLGAALARIVKLEEDLHTARTESQALRDQLAQARDRRDELLEQITEMRQRIQALEAA